MNKKCNNLNAKWMAPLTVYVKYVYKWNLFGIIGRFVYLMNMVLIGSFNFYLNIFI